MRKSLSILIIPLILSVACTRGNNKPQENKIVEQSKPIEQNVKVEEQSISEYYPFKENTEYKYAGEGNEYAAQDIYVDYIKDNRMQLRVKNAGTTAVKVIEKTEDIVTLVGVRGETYHKEDLTDMAKSEASDILLKAPIKEGNSWNTSSGDKRTITALDKSISTPFGELKALEVTTEGKDYIYKDYYAKGLGHVKSVYTDKTNKEFVVTTEIKEINENSPITEDIKFFYIKPEPTEFSIVYDTREIKIKTNEEVKDYFEKYLKTVPSSELTPLISKNTKINRMKSDQEKGIAYVDLSREFIDEMNAGSSVESEILTAVANTFGSYFGVREVLLTVGGEPYSSGHILLEKNETLKTELDKARNFSTM